MFLPLFLPFLLLPTLQATAPRVVAGEECDRACDGSPLHCVFSWTVRGQNASVGGVTREVTVVEDSQGPHLPGPPVVLCLGDFVTVELSNIKDAGTSIHWHGLFQRGSQTADGVPGVTQCPQMPGTSASWTFLAEPVGTLWYHSHAEFQRDDGLSGALVVRDVRREEEDTVCDLTEHIIHIQEWFNTPAEDRYYHSKGERPRSLLVNGHGRAELSNSSLPWEVFTVRPTECTAYRFRTVSAVTSHCPITLTVPGLNITVVASDGQEIKPEVVKSLTIANGERYDFIINTPDMEERTYQILFAGSPGQFTECSGLASMAFLQHGDSFVDQTMVPDYHKAVTVPGRHLNPCPSLALPSYQSPVPLASLVATQPLLQTQLAPDRTFYLLLGDGDNGASINNVQFNMSALAAGPPLLDFQTDLSSGDFCQTPYTELGELCDPSTDSCSCFHVLQTEVGDVVDLFLINPLSSHVVAHPVHLHGQHYSILGSGAIPDIHPMQWVREQEEQGSIPRNLDYPPRKDSAQTSPGYYTLVRVFASNPGYWLLHCHISYDLVEGQALVLRVGDPGDWGLEQGFPTCA